MIIYHYKLAPHPRHAIDFAKLNGIAIQPDRRNLA